MIIWPSSLPQVPTKNYSETSGVIVIRTSTDSGIAKQRRRGKKPSVLQVEFEMSSDQVVIFSNFVENTILGVKRFSITHPRLGTQVEVRMIPSGEGDLYTTSFITTDLWSVSFQLEIIP